MRMSAEEVRVGTDVPTVIDAGILSVAIMLGADKTFVFEVISPA